MDIVINVAVAAIVGLVSSFVALRLLPLDLDARRSAIITNLYGTIEKLNEKIEKQDSKIEVLENRKELTLKAELHIRLTDPPIIDKSTVEYLVKDTLVSE